MAATKKNSGVLTMSIEVLGKLIPPAEMRWLELKKLDELQLKFDREVTQLRLNHLLHRITDLDEQLEQEQMGEEEYLSMDSLRDRLNLRHQQLVESLVRIGTRLARTMKELRNRERSVYKNLLARGLI
ncbi:uncharacterized protein LOC128260191 [Drosophila gunungcola]|uniref:Uncharacterized protein n=1 Tax=Drosophila gunungcola TaxID=103775 RepID=A0A9P9YGR0_9MUSC|nr:uncharacterized protein LOC128260191 [Drosophila gunungcola]KAI8036671.1 hypothetical protein M5D96_010472 [Drosophila gunungcola]